jgi:transposase-like protein
MCTYQTISDFFGLNSRQDSNNFFRLFNAADQDFGAFLMRKRRLRETIPLIEAQILKDTIMSINEHCLTFCKEYPEFNMSLATFKNIIMEIDGLKLYNKVIKLSKLQSKVDSQIQDQEVDVSDISNKSIVPDISDLSKQNDDKRKRYNLSRNVPFFHKALLALLLLACGLNMDVIALIFGVAKSTVHNWVYRLPDMKKMILNSIKSWSGIVCIDEKWIKINGIPHYVLSVVDHITGFPLYVKTVANTQAVTWKPFMREFKKIYGNPKLIISDGSKSLASARKEVFPNISYQFCWFHKLKNLNDRIYKVKDKKDREKLLEMSDGMFHNGFSSSRKRTAHRIVAMNVPGVSEYVEKNILGNWKHLNKMLTSNAVERWNRKIKKVTSGRYGLKSVKFVEKLLEGLWLKEVIFDQRHLRKGVLTEIDVTKICQENLKPVQIIRFLKNKLFKRVA